MRAARRAAIALLLALATTPVAAVGAATAPRLVIEAPAELAPLAERLRQVDPDRLAIAARLVGGAPSATPIRVILVPEASPLARSAASWIAGFARPDLDTVVLFPARAPSYPDVSLDELLLHEVAHVLIFRATGGQPVPRWFNEGMAMIAGGAWGLDDRSRLTLALLIGEGGGLAELDRLFAAGRGGVARAYALSGSFVRDLLSRHGSGVGAEILAGLGRGEAFEDAFRAATGASLARVERSYWRRQTFWNRWVPVLTSSATLWFGITLLALWAGRRRRQQAAALKKKWEEEERWLEPPASDDFVH